MHGRKGPKNKRVHGVSILRKRNAQKFVKVYKSRSVPDDRMGWYCKTVMTDVPRWGDRQKEPSRIGETANEKNSEAESKRSRFVPDFPKKKNDAEKKIILKIVKTTGDEVKNGMREI